MKVWKNGSMGLRLEAGCWTREAGRIMLRARGRKIEMRFIYFHTSSLPYFHTLGSRIQLKSYHFRHVKHTYLIFFFFMFDAVRQHGITKRAGGGNH